MSLFDSLKVREIKEGGAESNESSFLFENLPINAGLTLYNLFRRALISYTSSVALCGVQIWDSTKELIKSEMSPLAGVDKISYYLISKLKEIIFSLTPEKKEQKLSPEEMFSFSLELKTSKEEREVLAGDFTPDSEGIVIKNPQLPLCVLAPESYLKIKLYCRKSSGYFASKNQSHLFENFNFEDHVIVLGTDYSPIEKGKIYSAKIEKEVISLTNEKEKFALKITTTGSVTPRETLKEALGVISEMIKQLAQSLK